MAGSLLRGRLLVASPTLLDPNFERTVVLILEHGDEGALGVVLNRPTETGVEEPLPAWHGLAARPPVVFVGGPVSRQAAIGLALAPQNEETDGWAPLFGRLGTVDLSRDPDDVEASVEQVRIFAGYAGWGADQLEGEIDQGAWVVVDPGPDDPLCDDPEELWTEVLERQGGMTAWLVNCPPDPGVN